ncbi:MAG: PAS domain S-box protein [Lentisphaerae bacterium]|nr:PAS domain S-box protein [Lentisphaerota bacterium]
MQDSSTNAASGQQPSPAVPIPETARASETPELVLQRLRNVVAVVDASPLVVFLWRFVGGQEWPVDYVSASVSQFGYTPEDFLSGRVSWVGVTHPDDVPRLEAEVARHHEQGITEFFQEYRLLTKSGEVRWVDDRTFAVRDAAGAITHYAGAIRDITPRKVALTRLSEQHATLHAIIDSINCSIFAVDRSYCYTGFNKLHAVTMKAHYGADIQLGGNLLDSITVPVDRENAHRNLDRAFRGELFTLDSPARQAGGEVETYLLIFNPIRTEGGDVIGATVVVQNVTPERTATAILRRSEEWFRALIEHAFGIVLVTDRSGVITFISSNVEHLMGYTVAETLGRSVFDFVHPDEAWAARGVLDDLLRTPGTAVINTYRARHRDGQWRWTEVVGQNLLDTPSMHALVFNLRDITERVEMEQALRESEERLRLTLQDSPIVVYHADRDLRYTWIYNPRHGFDVAGVLGKRDDELLPVADAAALMDLKRRVLETGRPERAQLLLHPLGTTAIYDVNILPQRGHGGAITGVTVVSVDVTERVAMEQALRESEDRLRVALHTVPIVVSHVDQDLRYTYIYNPRHGFRTADVVGRTDFDFLPPDLASTWMSVKRKVLEAGVGEHIQHEIELGGIRTSYDTVIEPVRGVDGAITGLTVVSFDITPLKRAEGEVRRLNAELEQRVAERTLALQESEERYRQFFNAQTHGAMVYGLDPLRIVDANAAACALYGYTREELLAIDPTVLTAEPVDSGNAFWRQVAGDLRPIPLRYHYRKDGTRFPLAIWPSLFSLQGQKVLGVTLVDVSRLQEAERQLRESETKFRVLAEESPNMIFINQGGRLVYVNPRCVDMLGYTREELYAPTFDVLGIVDASSAETVRRNLDTHLRGQETEPYECVLRTKTGRRLDALLATRIIEYEKGRAVFVIVTDVTASREAERTRLRQQERLQRLAAKLAVAQDEEQRRIADGLHDDVAQVLTACRYRLAGLQDGMSGDAVRETRADLDHLLEQAQKTIRSLSFELASSTLHQRELIPAIEALCLGMTQRYDVRFDFRHTGPRPALSVETTVVLFKATRELLFNVVKHAGVDRALVTVCTESNGVRIQVEDEGRGFTRSASLTETELGRGLGLFQIRERLRDVGGRMRVDSRPGVRTRITLTAPHAEE